MKITFQGNFSFKIETNKKTLLLNPQKNAAADKNLVLTIFSHFEEGDSFAEKPAIAWPGEFEYGGIAVKSYATREDSLAQYFELDGVRIAFLGDLKKIIAPEKLEPFVNADILFLPKIADGMPNKDLKKLVEEIDPRILVLAGEEAFFSEVFKELGADKPETLAVLEIEKGSLPQDHTRFIWLTAS